MDILGWTLLIVAGGSLLALDSNLDGISYRLLKHGFTFAAKGESIFYPLPSHREIEARNLKFWRTM